MEEIIEIVLNAMGVAQKNKLGTSKKDYVLSIVKLTLCNDVYDRYEPLISAMIDLIKNISNNKELIKELKKSNCYKSCIN